VKPKRERSHGKAGARACCSDNPALAVLPSDHHLPSSPVAPGKHIIVFLQLLVLQAMSVIVPDIPGFQIYKSVPVLPTPSTFADNTLRPLAHMRRIQYMRASSRMHGLALRSAWLFLVFPVS
jgi:hypothetical protein